MTWTRTVKLSEVPAGHTRPVTLEDDDILVCHTAEGHLFAVEDRCSHDGASFEDGKLDGCELTCPRHGARFDVTSGAALSMPAVAPVESYPVRRGEDDWIEVDIEP